MELGKRARVDGDGRQHTLSTHHQAYPDHTTYHRTHPGQTASYQAYPGHTTHHQAHPGYTPHTPHSQAHRLILLRREQPGVFQPEGRGCRRCLGVRRGNNYLNFMTHGKQRELRPKLKYVHGSLLEREGYIQLFTGTPMNSLAQQELQGRGAGILPPSQIRIFTGVITASVPSSPHHLR
ncbi:hypothetical protein E2C01_071369 [Portunus trituberculatus]|uniref:Uncharacterized protein n=1 Tax=Portunus trituberculatus TaxID=210409 RepID=A0A5B7HZS9_PORTR|nr:hypothetical protein [Portunus trituberculatus]